MFRHVVVFAWTADSTAEQRVAAVTALRGWAEEAVRYGQVTVGLDSGLAEGNDDLVVVIDLPDKDTYLASAADERHKAVVQDHVRPILAPRSAVQHEM